MSYEKERAWISKKLRSGVSLKELRESVGMFSNKNKKKVMAQKGLSEDGYNKRYSFFANVYTLLCDTPSGVPASASKRADSYQRKKTSEIKRFIKERYGTYENYSRMKRETDRLKKKEAYDFFYGK